MIRLLGPLELLVEGHSRALGSPKQKAVLAILALAGGRVVSTDRLVGELWGDDPPDSSVSTLQVYISRIRAAVGRAAGDAAEADLRVLRRAPGYALEVADDGLDSRLFHRLTAGAAERLTDDPAWARAQLDIALALPTGPPLGDLTDQLGPSSAAEVQRLSEMVLAAQELRLEARVLLGESAAVLQEAAQLAAAHPLRESVRGMHILALYRAGRQAEALDAYESVRRDLADELGIDPTPALRRLHAQILRHDPALDVVPVRDTASLASRRSVPMPRPAPGALQLFGRDTALASLQEAIAAAVGGSGSVWLVTGEAGIGKTVLSEEVARIAAASGFTVGWGRSHETADLTPFWPWIQVLRGLPDIAVDGEVGVLLGSADPIAGLPPAAARIRIYDEVATLLLDRAAAAPMLLVLEDLHWADELTLELLAVLVERSAGTALMVVCTYRGDDAGPETAMGALLARTARHPHVERLVLEGLAVEDVGRLLAARLPQPPSAALVDTARDRSDGNPFFLTELARMAVDDPGDLLAAWSRIPRSVRDVILRRVSGVSRDQRTVLDVASVVGRTCDLDLLSAVSGLDDAALDDAVVGLVAAGLMTEHLRPRPGVRFLHALVRETLYDRLRPTTRARLHAAVGTAMNPGERSSDLDALAYHLVEGADVVGAERVLPILLRAARSAHERLAYEHAERLLERSRTLLDRVPAGPERNALDFDVSVLQSTLYAALLGATAPRTAEALERALRLSVDEDPDVDVFATLYGVAATRTLLGDFDVVIAMGEQVLARAVPGPTGERWELLGRWIIGVVRWYQGDFRSSGAHLGRALELAVVHGAALVGPFFQDPVFPVRTFLAFTRMLDGSGAAGAAVISAQLAEARLAGEPFQLGNALLFGTVAAVLADDPDAASGLASETEMYCTQHGFGFNALLARLFGGWATACRPGTGASGAAAGVARLEESLDAFRAAGARSNQTFFLGLLSEARSAAGQRPAAVVALAEAEGLADTTGEHFFRTRLDRQRMQLDGVAAS